LNLYHEIACVDQYRNAARVATGKRPTPRLSSCTGTHDMMTLTSSPRSVKQTGGKEVAGGVPVKLTLQSVQSREPLHFDLGLQSRLQLSK
jgi:hypothetical protein